MIITDLNLLRVKCSDASVDEASEIINKLEQELKHSMELGRPGLGLAAPQIGIDKNVAIVRMGFVNNAILNVNLVNCKIEKSYDRVRFDNEGCLSVPGVIKSVYRYNEVVVCNNLFDTHSFVATGLFSACIQHELDHLSGILITDISI